MQARNEYEARGILTNTALNGGGSACCSGIKNRDSEGSNVESRRGMSAFNSDTTSFRARQSGTQNRHGGDAAPGGDGAVAHSLRESWTSCAAFAGAFLVATTMQVGNRPLLLNDQCLFVRAGAAVEDDDSDNCIFMIFLTMDIPAGLVHAEKSEVSSPTG